MKTWIVVADSARARIFESSGKTDDLRLAKDLEHPASQAHERDLITDRPGRTFDSNGPGRHAMSESVSPKEHESAKFCKTLSDAIEHARNEQAFDRLVIVAAPAFLGQLRKMLSASAAQLVTLEIDKNLAQMDEQDILAHLPTGLL